jgi:hypothetical protein
MSYSIGLPLYRHNQLRSKNIKMIASDGPDYMGMPLITEDKPKGMVTEDESKEDSMITKYKPKGKPKVVILGAGWGGFNFGNQIDKDLYDVTLVSPRNHFLFTPLLASSAVGTLEYKCIQEPVRSIANLNYR